MKKQDKEEEGFSTWEVGMSSWNWASCSIRESLMASSSCLASSSSGAPPATSRLTEACSNVSRESLSAASSSRCSWASRSSPPSCSGEGGAMVFRVAALGVLLHQTRRMIQHGRGQALRRWRSRCCPWCLLHPPCRLQPAAAAAGARGEAPAPAPCSA
jgi:hypothetical protein